MGYLIKSFDDYTQAYKRSVDDPDSFWDEIAGEFLWRKKWVKTLEWNFEKK